MGLIDNLKDAADLAKAIGNTELYRKIVELEGEVIDLTRENRELSARLAETTEALRVQGMMTFDAPFWFQEGDNTPFCPSCYELKRSAIHVVLVFSNSEGTQWDCPVCKTRFMAKGGRGRRNPEPPRRLVF